MSSRRVEVELFQNRSPICACPSLRTAHRTQSDDENVNLLFAIIAALVVGAHAARETPQAVSLDAQSTAEGIHAHGAHAGLPGRRRAQVTLREPKYWGLHDGREEGIHSGHPRLLLLSECPPTQPCPADKYRLATAEGQCVLQTPGASKRRSARSSASPTACTPTVDAPCPPSASPSRASASAPTPAPPPSRPSRRPTKPRADENLIVNRIDAADARPARSFARNLTRVPSRPRRAAPDGTAPYPTPCGARCCETPSASPRRRPSRARVVVGEFADARRHRAAADRVPLRPAPTRRVLPRPSPLPHRPSLRAGLRDLSRSRDALGGDAEDRSCSLAGKRVSLRTMAPPASSRRVNSASVTGTSRVRIRRGRARRRTPLPRPPPRASCPRRAEVVDVFADGGVNRRRTRRGDARVPQLVLPLVQPPTRGRAVFHVVHVEDPDPAQDRLEVPHRASRRSGKSRGSCQTDGRCRRAGGSRRAAAAWTRRTPRRTTRCPRRGRACSVARRPPRTASCYSPDSCYRRRRSPSRSTTTANAKTLRRSPAGTAAPRAPRRRSRAAADSPRLARPACVRPRRGLNPRRPRRAPPRPHPGRA